MPIYEYACGDCGERFEILQRMGAGRDGLKCPRCQGEKLEKQPSRFAGSSTSSGGCGTGSAAPS